MKAVNVFDYEKLALARIEASAWDYYASGSDDEVTLRANRAAFERIRLRPRMLADVSTCRTATTVLGTPVSMPILIAPTAFHCLAHPEGECATASAAGRAGTLMVASTSSTRSLEEIAHAASGPLWFQLYLHDAHSTQRLIERAITAGYRALVVTVDSPRWGHKERSIRSNFRLPPHLQKANFGPGDTVDDSRVNVTWESLAWLRSLTSLPIILKGILTAEDAEIAVQHRVGGIIVSNHGGRQLDGVSASIEALPEVVAAVAGQCEVYVDGGIRRGTDVLKALALGARAVLVGRPILWGLAANGADGVEHVLEILRNELELAMVLAGRPTIESIDRSLVKLDSVSEPENTAQKRKSISAVEGSRPQAETVTSAKRQGSTIILITAPCEAEWLHRLQRLYPDFQIIHRTDAIPAHLWREVEILYTSFATALPSPEQAPRLKWVQLYSAGIDSIVHQPLFRTAVVFTTASGVHATPMAEYVFTMILAWFHRFPQLLAWKQREQWPTGAERQSLFLSEEVSGKTLGIVGYGSIGREVARAAKAFGMHVLAMQHSSNHSDSGFRFPGTGDPEGSLPDRYYTPDQLHMLLGESDIVLIAVPLTAKTAGMFDRAAFAAMKPTAFLINIARGEVCDEAALIDALTEKHIGGAALDVFHQEPLPAHHPLWGLPNVFISPHTAGLTPHYNERAATIFEENLRRYLTGEPLLNVADKTEGY